MAIEPKAFSSFAKEIEKRISKEDEKDPLAKHRRGGLYKLTSDDKSTRTNYPNGSFYDSQPEQH